MSCKSLVCGAEVVIDLQELPRMYQLYLLAAFLCCYVRPYHLEDRRGNPIFNIAPELVGKEFTGKR